MLSFTAIIKEVVGKRLQIYSKLDDEIRKTQENEAMARMAEQRQKIEEASALESTEEPKPDDTAATPQVEETPEEPATDKEAEPAAEPESAAAEVTDTTEETQEES